MRVGEIWTRLERVRRPALLQEKNPRLNTQKERKVTTKAYNERNKSSNQIS